MATDATAVSGSGNHYTVTSADTPLSFVRKVYCHSPGYQSIVLRCGAWKETLDTDAHVTLNINHINTGSTIATATTYVSGSYWAPHEVVLSLDAYSGSLARGNFYEVEGLLSTSFGGADVYMDVPYIVIQTKRIAGNIYADDQEFYHKGNYKHRFY